MSYTAPQSGTAVEIRCTEQAGDRDTEIGVIIHPGIGWLLAYFPGDLERPVVPGDPGTLRVVPTADVLGYHELVDCDPSWVLRSWNNLHQAGAGILQAHQAVRVWALSARVAQHRLATNPPPLITLTQAQAWAGRTLTDADLANLAQAIPDSSIPDALGEIIAGMDARNSG